MGGKARRITEWQGGSFLFWSGGASALGLGGDGEGTCCWTIAHPDDDGATEKEVLELVGVAVGAHVERVLVPEWQRVVEAGDGAVRARVGGARGGARAGKGGEEACGNRADTCILRPSSCKALPPPAGMSTSRGDWRESLPRSPADFWEGQAASLGQDSAARDIRLADLEAGGRRCLNIHLIDEEELGVQLGEPVDSLPVGRCLHVAREDGAVYLVLPRHLSRAEATRGGARARVRRDGGRRASGKRGGWGQG
eukprot:scaffold676_cov115-Isochrysis_galbana.AAC.7